MQRLAKEDAKRVSADQEKVNAYLEKRRKRLDSWYKELHKRVALKEHEKQKPDDEKTEREKEMALKSALKLERQLDTKHKLEMETEELKGKVQVMKHLGDEDDTAVQEKIKETKNELQTKMEEMTDMEILNHTLMVKERQSNDELREALKELIKGKVQVMKHLGDEDDVAVQQNIKSPEWHVVQVDDDHKEVLNENDKLLKNLKAERGNGKFDAVVTAFMEINEYNNSCGIYVVNKLWNFKDNQKVKMKVEKRIFLLMKLLLLMMVLIGVIIMALVIMLTKVPLLLTLP